METILTVFRYYLFRAIQIFVHICSKETPEPSRLLSGPSPDLTVESGYIWVFVSTIGELNAIKLILDDILARESLVPVLLTDRPHYCKAFKELYPDAAVAVLGPEGHIDQIVYQFRPKIFLMAEIPCFLSDGPCRFAYRVLYDLKRQNVPIVLVNGWLYGEVPSCRIDAVEYWLLNRDFVRAIDLYLVQSNEVKQKLLLHGASDDNVFVTGNCKFDQLNALKDLPKVPAGLAGIIENLGNTNRPILIAGCVTNYKEQECILDAVAISLRTVPDLLLIFAPRYPEKHDRMDILFKMLDARNLGYMKRTEFNAEKLTSTSTLVLDSIGELRYLYQVSSISFVGRNHNVLEPMAFGNNVMVTPDWNVTYPSYPVYEATKKAELIFESDSPIAMANYLTQVVRTGNNSDSVMEISRKLATLGGAVEESLILLRKKGYL